MLHEAAEVLEFLLAAARETARRQPAVVAGAVEVAGREVLPLPERPQPPVRHRHLELSQAQHPLAVVREAAAVMLPFHQLLQRMPVLRLRNTTPQSPS